MPSARLLSLAALICLAALTVVLARQNRTLREQLTVARSALFAPPPGMQVPGFRAATLSGDSIRIGRVPLTVVLDPSGSVRYSRIGSFEMGSSAMDSILQVISASPLGPRLAPSAAPLSGSSARASGS
jgi:hypothetical protein